MFSYPLTQIILYIALFFAPPDTTHITVAGPDYTMELVREGSVWSHGAIRFSINDGQLIRQENSTRETQAVGDYVKAAVGHNWITSPKITLHDLTTLEKTASGFVVRVNDGDPTVRSHTITYRRPAIAHAPTATINVLGEVNQPGAYPLPSGATLLDALAAAGGTGARADTRKVSIVRGPAGEKPVVVQHDVSALLRGEIANPVLIDRDTVFVPEKIF